MKLNSHDSFIKQKNIKIIVWPLFSIHIANEYDFFSIMLSFFIII